MSPPGACVLSRRLATGLATGHATEAAAHAQANQDHDGARRGVGDDQEYARALQKAWLTTDALFQRAIFHDVDDRRIQSQLRDICYGRVLRMRSPDPNVTLDVPVKGKDTQWEYDETFKALRDRGLLDFAVLACATENGEEGNENLPREGGKNDDGGESEPPWDRHIARRIHPTVFRQNQVLEEGWRNSEAGAQGDTEENCTLRLVSRLERTHSIFGGYGATAHDRGIAIALRDRLALDYHARHLRLRAARAPSRHFHVRQGTLSLRNCVNEQSFRYDLLGRWGCAPPPGGSDRRAAPLVFFS